MRSIKTYESFGKDINQFIDLVFNDISPKVGNLYDMFQDLKDDDYKLYVLIGLKGSQYEEGYNRDIIDLFSVDHDLNISDSIVDDGSQSGYVDWILQNDFGLLLEDVVFVIYFGCTRDIWKRKHNEFIDAIDNFLSKMNYMFDYHYIAHINYSDEYEEGVRLDCQL